LPCLFTAWEKAVHSLSGTLAAISSSILAGSWLETAPSRFMTLMTWVSTMMPGRPAQAERITWALFLPMPGKLVSSSIP
jgi:hypothetical protein